MSSDGRSQRIPPVSSDEFRRACGRFATGIAVASVADSNGAPHGLTVNSFSSVSLEPPLILICIGHAVTSIGHFRAASHFGLNMLAEDQLELSHRFARKGEDRFDNLRWHWGKSGAPLLDGVLAQMECAVRQRVPAGDHDIFVAEMIAAQVYEGEPLIYYASSYRSLAP
jgi:flavin reductase (DIM6/NTAB) family NADH-FMN oxidoreductase RutF